MGNPHSQTRAGTIRVYAVSMPEPAQPAPPKIPGSFANLLASFTGNLHDEEWDDSALADDVSTITYEQALRAGCRGLSPRFATNSLLDESPEASSVPTISKPAAPRLGGQKQSRSASITIRVTAEEQAKLHDRAAAAKLSVSAYLRSCIFEAESLRTQVKEALAQMQSASPQTASAPTTEATPHDWRKRFFPAWSRRRTTEG
ncbi:MAG TPA: hypothetical protein VN753_10825 [Terracidiphilus sp.]|nr:hypothetical protein [Terracidiphilus sp.]